MAQFRASCGHVCECRERAEKRATRWLCCEAAANESLQPNSLIRGKIQGISLETSLPVCTKPLRNGASLDEFPAIETGNFFRQIGKNIAPNSELGKSAR